MPLLHNGAVHLLRRAADVAARLGLGAGRTGSGAEPRRPDVGVVVTAAMLVVGCGAALSIDVVRTTYGLKGDEATYVAMALSAAYDGDLAYEAQDVERFYQIYHDGPQGIFLKRGGGDRRSEDRLYFGKAYIYSVLAAPFVRVAGLNGMLAFHVVLLSGAVLLGYLFLAAHSPRRLSLAYTLGFLGVSIVPVYAVFLTSEIFHVAGVFYAYFLWFYKDVAPRDADGVAARLRGGWTDVAAAVILGLVTFSKPLNVLLIGPPVLVAWGRRRFRAGLVMGMVFALTVTAGFAINAFITGDVIYQGGDRKTFYGTFPFEHEGATFGDLGIGMSTNEVVVEEPLEPAGFLRLLGTNLWYFVAGRHFGFLPFFFPGIVAVWLFLRERANRTLRGWLIVCTVAATALGTIIYMPYTWSGGGGPSGNRYFLSIYPALFFITPRLASFGPVAVSWLGGGLFMAHILMNPFVSAKQPYLSVEDGLLRALPVELTMVNDLPINLDAPRARVQYGDPAVLLYYLDHNAYRPEPPGVWVAARQRADIIVRAGAPIERATLTLMSRVPNTVEVSLGGATRRVDLAPGVRREVTLQPDGVYARHSWAYLLSVRSEAGFVPRLVEPGSRDSRYLGVAVQLTPRFGEADARSLRGW